MVVLAGCAFGPRPDAPPAPSASADAVLKPRLIAVGFRDAQALALDVDGAVLVLERGGLVRLPLRDPASADTAALAPPDSVRRWAGDAPVALVDGRALALDGRLRLVADAAGAVLRVSPDGVVLDALGTGVSVRRAGFEPDPALDVFAPVGVRPAPNGGVLALDAASRRLVRWDAGRRRVPPDPNAVPFDDPRALAAWGAGSAVLDEATVVVLDRFGTVEGGWAVPPGATGLGAFPGGKHLGGGLGVVYPGAIRVYASDGTLIGVLRASLPDPIRAVAEGRAFGGRTVLFLLTGRALYAAPLT